MFGFKRNSKFFKQFGLFALGASFSVQQVRRFTDEVQGSDRFSQHTREQHRKNPFSGMHEPFMPTSEQREFFEKNFPEYKHLLPTDLETFKKQQAIKTPVRIKPLSECPVTLGDKKIKKVKIVASGGPPAFKSAAMLAYKGKQVTYINDPEQRPIAYGSAFHFEPHPLIEAPPTSYSPLKFGFIQFVWRPFFNYESFKSIGETGEFSWRTCNVYGWMCHPEQWLPGLRVAYGFQQMTMASQQEQEATFQKVDQLCQYNKENYNTLHKEFLREGIGGVFNSEETKSIMIASTSQESVALQKLITDLKEKANPVSEEEMKRRYGLEFQGLLFGEKTNDGVISSDIMEKAQTYIVRKGGKTEKGVITTVYADDQHEEGIVEYRTSTGARDFLRFDYGIFSLGRQPILDQNNKPLFDVVAARGVSMLAYVDVPEGSKVPSIDDVPEESKLPSMVIFGEVNHATVASKKANRYLVKFTTGACITPNVSEEDAVNYDGRAAWGLLTAARKILKDCKVEPIFIHGCNRQIGEAGLASWIRYKSPVRIGSRFGGSGYTLAMDKTVIDEAAKDHKEEQPVTKKLVR